MHRIPLVLRHWPAALAAALSTLALAMPPSALASGRQGPGEGRSANERAEPARPGASSTAARRLDRSGRARVGTASFYHRRFAGQTMANGEPMDPHDDNAASKTLPLGTRARVTNLENGRTATVTIEDRGPYVKGRILDVSPATAQKLGIDREEGLAQVEVAPIAVPQPDGSVRPGEAVRRR